MTVLTNPGMFGSIVYIDLVGIDEATAKKKLLDEITIRVENRRKKPEKKPSFQKIKKQSVRPGPSFEMIPVAFRSLRLGSRIDEMVGREDALKWLEDQIINSENSTTALSSVHGAGGIGKTFLARVFAEKFKNKTKFLPIYLGETKPFEAGIQLLTLQNYDVSTIDSEEKLRSMLRSFYSNGEGVVLIDDVRTEDAEMLFPEVTTWKVLLTTRYKDIASKLCGDRNVKELSVLSPAEAITLELCSANRSSG